jgi:rubredoxin
LSTLFNLPLDTLPSLGFDHKKGSAMQWKKYECVICGFIYDEELGLPDEGIAPGTKWEDVPEDWECPECGVSKFDFELVDEAA